ncbi:hypothetical protein EK21DRAFT_79823 [Setomelanomma holmii]|uniref:F-box domain-containing protein n=1 Tax=Setomelanomma holmii TaxID=210430 RepID=A0A9P4GWE0_9PLEO|nr:hypothetical protein EK21DRAFT_79823 [Setomelanomma holmii]
MDLAVPPPDGACHFLRLPGELRSSIHKYAFRTPGGAVCRVTKDSTTCKDLFRFLAVEVAAPKFTNRQLRDESKTLALLHNELVFKGGVNDVTRFLRAIPGSLVSLLRPITVIESKCRGHWVFEDLAAVCRKNLKAFVRMRYSWLDPSNNNFFWRATKLAIILRKDESIVQRICSVPSMHSPVLSLILKDSRYRSLSGIEAYPPNLRLYPLAEYLDAAAFRRLVREYDFMLIRVRQMPGGIDAAIAWAKELHERGI